ncbi:endonuclease VIII [Rouxiella chamberiensis]|uniref:DNA-(apurinic or apyrimidinic site) lyase n=1 Tax=Rouxiella chamberiensis TaxID=1513468 RepID=A0ABY7HLP0_9GAMM|nr:endonuclease VIII [Rouxiella chamberiensis]WAS99845.1 endonuclease VIII [Rouxiella chamberiensis]
MPEGPEIRRAADQLERAVLGKPLTDVWFAFPTLQPYQTQLTGEKVKAIETRGKALLTHFTNHLTLYTHNQLYGVWRVFNSGDEINHGKRSLRVKLATADSAILLYSASEIEIWPTDDVYQHPFLQRIGPDVLDEKLTVEQVRERLVSTRFYRRQLGGMLLDQAFLAGLGNYLRAEILWLAKLLPSHKPADLDDAQLDLLAAACLSIARHSYAMRGTMDENVHHGAMFRFKVFARAGKRCERCGEKIVKTSVSSRPFFYCAGCQH